MPKTYFKQLIAETPTRVWVNNPTIAEMDLALAQGAQGSTTNPAYGGNLLRRAPEEILPIIEECVRLSDDDLVVGDLVQQRLVGRIADRFRPLFDDSGGHAGFVSIQGAPERDTDPRHILAEAHEGHGDRPNATPKIPATGAGFAAFETLVAEGCPTIVTEVFSVDQLVEACERYERAQPSAAFARRSSSAPSRESSVTTSRPSRRVMASTSRLPRSSWLASRSRASAIGSPRNGLLRDASLWRVEDPLRPHGPRRRRPSRDDQLEHLR